VNGELRDLAEELVALALSAYPFEACGVVLKNWTWVELLNTADDTTRAFEFTDEATIKWFGQRRADLLGVFHTHPGGTISPSATDAEFAYSDLRYFIATQSDMYEWKFEDGRSPKPVDPLTGTLGLPDLAYPILSAPEPLRPEPGDAAAEGRS